MTPFGPYYPLVLDAVMRHAERLTDLLSLRERALSHRDPGWPWLIGRAAELRCVASVLGADWHKGRIPADVAAVELAQYLRQLHRGLAEHLRIRKPGCCYIGWLAQLLVVAVVPAMVSACARGTIDGSFDPPVPGEASAASLPPATAHDKSVLEASASPAAQEASASPAAQEASASPVDESGLDAGASWTSDRADDDATRADVDPTATVSIAVPSPSPPDATAPDEEAPPLMPTQEMDATVASEEAETATEADAPDTSDATATADAIVEETAVLPGLGELLITEVMFTPSGLVPNSEWFEVLNSTDSPKLLSGLTILDGYSDPHVIAGSPPVVAPAQSYVLLVRDRAAALAGGISPACIVYEYGAAASPYGGIELAGAGGEVSLWNGNTQLADVAYGQWIPAPHAQSLELGLLQLVGSNVASNWCLAERPWGVGTDNGTPGAPGDCK
jgi:hypothetical protein